MSRNEGIRVALLGRRLPDNENLGLGYLQVALSSERVTAKRYVLNGADAIGPVAEAVVRDGVELVGISMPDGGSAVNFLAFGEMLRRVGYSGVIVAGGAFATLARDWLLRRYAWLDAVVRFAGELPLVGIVHALAEGRSFDDVAGVTTRRGDGVPALVTAWQPTRMIPTHDELPRLLGHRVAHVQATRGCAGRCDYCGPAALQSLEYSEGLRAGTAPNELRRHGVGGIRRRPVEHLAQEIKRLHDQGTRYFYFVDEHFLPYRTSDALDYLAQLRTELNRKQVGRFGLGCMLKAERLHTDLVEPLVESGLIRAFIGLEFSTAEEGRLYRRRVDPCHGRKLLAELEGHGAACVANLMLVHPYSTRDTIRAGIEHLSSIESGIVETTRMMVYHGTRLHSELEREGRIFGNPLRYGYKLQDPVAQRFSEAFAPLRLRVFGDHSLAQVMHGVAMTLALARRLHANGQFEAIQAECRAMERTVRSFTVDCLRRVFHVVHAAASTDSTMRMLFAELGETSMLLRRRVDQLEDDISRALRIQQRRFAPTRAAAASTLAFTLLGTAAVACSAYDDDPVWPVGGGGATSGSGGSATSLGSGGIAATRICNGDEDANLAERVRSIVEEQDSCFSGVVWSKMPPSFNGWTIGASVMSRDCFGYTTCGSFTRANEANIAAALAASTPPDCTTLTTVPIAGGGQLELDNLNAAVKDCTPEYPTESFSIQVDAKGSLVDVTSETLPAATVDCIRAALKDLIFPCLGSTDICPEACIIE